MLSFFSDFKLSFFQNYLSCYLRFDLICSFRAYSFFKSGAFSMFEFYFRPEST